jgi:microcystin degradation protein MlrC
MAAALPVIAIAGLGIETSTFSPARSDLSAFHIRRGQNIIDENPFLRTPALADAAQWHGAVVAGALPGGVVTASAFETMAREIETSLCSLRQANERLDGLWLVLHGAMVAEGMDDAEVVLLRRIRAVVGPETLVSASMDLHGNVSRNLVHGCDLLTCYRTAPHVDVMETRARACRNLVQLLRRRDSTLFTRPLKAWVPIPVLLGGEQTSTRVEPAKGIYKNVGSIAEGMGIIDASVWVGYAWADEPRNRAAVVVTGWDQQAVSAGAEELASSYWRARKAFDFVAPVGSLSQCLDKALAKDTKRPFFISDSGDNPTAGAAGDVTWGLARLLAREEFEDVSAGWTVIYAGIPGPKAAADAVAAGVGATLTVSAGAEVDHIHEGPVTMKGRVHAIKHGDRDAGIEVVLQVGCVFVIVTQKRKPYHHEADFTELNLRPRQADVVVVKIGYLEPELFHMAAAWMMALTPGGVDQDLLRLGHKRLRRPMWPFDTQVDWEPDLRARRIPAANCPLDGTDE